ncbi:hypothetical protein CXB51_032579 [Gossypium anomalum]|uniref:Uncharacterized protein n=1 Tax=Gossypium anomalum TaxID=47600 RepID=A0A8J6CKL1_9ROSI|nr:hypothetical protein CXB51_032579 [Gossypium anomalum]
MGSSESKAADSKANRIARWRSTGIVALREAKLKSHWIPPIMKASWILDPAYYEGKLDQTPNCMVYLLQLNRCRVHVYFLSLRPLISGNYISESSRVGTFIPYWLRNIVVQTFPYGVLDLDKSVRTLDLTQNKLVEIPMEISKLVNMQRLVRYSQLLLAICRVSFHVIQTQILACNHIEQLPSTMGNLQSLKAMILDGNRITSLPDELGELVKLEKLSISGNMLMSLPNTIGSLRNLSLLNVSNNKLKYLPESIGICSSLEELQANDNLIEELPASVCNLVQLKSLSLNNNKVNQASKGPSRFCHPNTTVTEKPSIPIWGRETRVPCCQSTIPPNILKDCKALQNFSLHDNPISMSQFQQMDGFEEFEARRKKKFDKQLDSNVMIGSKGLDEGVDL